MTARRIYSTMVMGLWLGVWGGGIPGALAARPDRGVPDSAFKYWALAPDHVVGIFYLPHPAHRKYFVVHHPDSATTVIQEFNPSDVCVQLYLIVCIDHRLLTIVNSNQWGGDIKNTQFVSLGKDDYLVTKLSSAGVNLDWPCAQEKYVFREGLLAEVHYLDRNGNLCNNKSGYAREVFNRYKTGARTGIAYEFIYEDAAGRPVLSKESGCHRFLSEFDEQGNQVMKAYWNVQNQPMSNKFGVFRVQNTFDENGNIVKAENKDLSGRLMKSIYGAAYYVTEFKDGWEVQQTVYDDQGNITRSSEAAGSIAITKRKLDSRGNEIEKSYYDEQGNAINNQRGIHKIQSTYSDQDLLIYQSYWDRGQQPAQDVTKTHAYRYEYDRQGRKISEAFFNASGQPTSDNFDKVNMIKYQYDEGGQLLSESYWQNNLVKMSGVKGNQQKIFRYDSLGQLRCTDYLDEDGKLSMGTIGYSREQIDYNAGGKVRERSFFDGERPVLMEASSFYIRNYHAILYAYDTLNRVNGVAYLDEMNRPTNARADIKNDESAGIPCHRVEFIYKGNRLAEERIYTTDAQAEPVVLDCLKQISVGISGQGVTTPVK